MQVYINEKPTTVNHNSITLNSFFKEIQLDLMKGIAVAVNGEVISKNSWGEYHLQENDKLIIIKATQGG